ncbi:unnamed protein product [Protopolystoma xenopodis]|uniref:Uncharacterized protein n=1 Tax=Protopolystoma xenopodis TaxID=117903 RepID=A0A3S5B9D1_9PLAT|nr:unnamed protein product [Protopolystoma xenopodis]
MDAAAAAIPSVFASRLSPSGGHIPVDDEGRGGDHLTSLGCRRFCVTRTRRSPSGCQLGRALLSFEAPTYPPSSTSPGPIPPGEAF